MDDQKHDTNIVDEFGTQEVICLTKEEHCTDMVWFTRPVNDELVALYQRNKSTDRLIQTNPTASLMMFMPRTMSSLTSLEICISDYIAANTAALPM